MKSSINECSGLWLSNGLPVRESDKEKIQARGKPRPQSLNTVMAMVDEAAWKTGAVQDMEIDQRGYIPVFIWSWITVQATGAKDLVQTNKFVSADISDLAKQLAAQIDDQIGTSGLESMLWSLKWTRTCLEFLSLFKMGAKSWDCEELSIFGHQLRDWIIDLIDLTIKRLQETRRNLFDNVDELSSKKFSSSRTSTDQHQLQSEGAFQNCHLQIMMISHDDEWEGVPFDHKVDERGYVPIIFWQWIRKQASSSTEYTSAQTFRDEKCKARAMLISKQIDSKVAADKIKSMIWSSKWTQRTLELLAAFTLGIQDFSISNMGYWGPGSKWISGLVTRTIRRLVEQEGGLQALS